MLSAVVPSVRVTAVLTAYLTAAPHGSFEWRGDACSTDCPEWEMRNFGVPALVAIQLSVGVGAVDGERLVPAPARCSCAGVRLVK